MNQFLGGNECEKLSHTQNNNHRVQKLKEEANNQTDTQNSVLSPPEVPSLQILGLG